MVGQVIGERYRIERKIGEGGMGAVYLARHILMERQSAIKLMSPGLSKDADAIARFNREATNASRISHPNVCAVYDFGFTPEGVLFLAMEYLEGSELSELIADRPMALDRAADLIAQCAAGLQAAHDLGIVHRDLKPDNIMVLSARGREVVKLVDFGIAKAAQGEEGQRVTKTGLVVGTPEYMSPEQLAGDTIDGRSDQYALALVLCRVLTGTLPFTALSAQETMVKRLTERPKRLSELTERRFPAELDDVIARALERPPGARFASVEEFAAAVGRVAAAQSAGTVSLPRTEVVSSGRGRRGVLAAGAGIALLAVAFVAWRVAGAGDGLDQASPPPLAPAVAVQADSTALSDTVPPASAAETVPPPAVPPAPPPAPPPPPPGPGTPQDRLPVLEDFEEPASARALAAFERAKRAMASPRLSNRQRANQAWFVGLMYLEQGDRAEAARTFRRSCRLDRKPRCAAMLRQFENQP